MQHTYSQISFDLEADEGYTDRSIKVYLNNLYEEYRHRQKQKNTMAWILHEERCFNYRSFEREIMIQVDEDQPYLDLGCNFDKFWNTAFGLVIQIIRVLQRYIDIQCQAPIKSLLHRDIKPIVKQIIKDKASFRKEHYQTFVRINTFRFNFDKVELTKKQCLSLYEALIYKSQLKQSTKETIINIVNKRVIKFEDLGEEYHNNTQTEEKCSENNPTFYLNKMWNMKYQEELIKAFRINQDFVAISNIFLLKYPHLTKYFQPKSLKNRMRRTLRICFQKLKKNILPKLQGQVPTMDYFGDTIAKNFERSPGCHNIQLLLLKVWDNSFKVSDITNMINSMNIFIKKFNEEKETGIERRGRRKKFVLTE